MITKFKLFGALTLLTISTVSSAEVLFFSNQANTLDESNAVRSLVLSGHSGKVDFVAVKKEPWISRVEVEGKAGPGKGKIGLSMGLHGDFSGLKSYLSDIDDVVNSGKADAVKTANPALLELAKMGGEHYKYVPVMQASYIFSAHVKAFEHLPEGLTRAAVEAGNYTYADVLAWAKKMKAATGENKVAFPAGDGGLIHRFFQGYLYPAFTGGVVSTFGNADAVEMWNYFDELWQYVYKASEASSHMQELLMLEFGPWLVFDHTSRLKGALDEKPNEIVALPSPSGKYGKAFMTVLAGVSIPNNTPERSSAIDLIEYLMKSDVQLQMLRATGFYPVVDVELSGDLANSAIASAAAISKQSGANDSLPALLPVGLGDKSGLFSKIYKDTFTQIVLRGKKPESILKRQSAALNKLMQQAAAPCWAPDKPSNGPCQVSM